MKKIRPDEIGSFAALTLLVLMILSFFPSLFVPLGFKPIDLFSELRVDTLSNDSVVNGSDSSFIQTADATSKIPVIRAEETDTLPARSSSSQTDNTRSVICDIEHKGTYSKVAFEDYSPNTILSRSIANNFRSIGQSRKQMRIAFVEDSFIEADILTAYLRDALQCRYGGEGVGFVPMASPASAYRTTVEHKHSGWKAYSIVKYQQADWSKILLSRCYYVPSEGAQSSFKAVNQFKRTGSFTSARR